MSVSNLSMDEKIDRLRLIRAPGIGPITFFELLRRYRRAGDAIKALPGLTAGRRNEIKPMPRREAEKEMEATIRYGGEILCVTETGYPPMLKKLEAPPPLLSVIANDRKLFSRPGIAIVGARNATAGGLEIVTQMAAELGEAGYVIVSGLARGIDGKAHTAALKTGTIAVLAGGVDNVYPKEHRALYDKIREKGAIVSEAPFGYNASHRDFPRRNRLITGLAMGVVVIEATQRSGSLISAQSALDQNREVMAVPGSPFESRSSGTNMLIKSGAHLVESAEDIIALLSGRKSGMEYPDEKTDFETDIVSVVISDDLVDRIFDLIGTSPVHIDTITRHADVTAREAACAVAELELAGKVISDVGGLVERTIGD